MISYRIPRALTAVVMVGLASASLSMLPGSASANPAFAVETVVNPVQASGEVAVVEAEIERAGALRAAKTLQYAYAQFGEYGLWSEMAALFSLGGELVIGDRTIAGPAAIETYLRDEIGQGRDGLPAGSVNTQLMMAPVVTLAADGETARGRWQELTLRGRMGGSAEWSGGMQVNDYVREDGVWKIARMNVIPQFEGPYETGWFSIGAEIPFVPYHYTSEEAGRPVSALTAEQQEALRSAGAQTALPDLERRVARMNDEDQVRNLQNIYGYYQDRKMWDDATDLFESDAVFEIAGLGIYEGVASIRRAFELQGPQNLQRGQVNDQLQLHTLITVAPGGSEAVARGLQFGMLTPELGQAYWSISTFENRFAKGADGKWRIREMRIYPRMKTDYYQGWHRSSVVEPVPTGAGAPDRPSPADRSPQVTNVIPAFFDNPVTGRPVTIPNGFTVVGDLALRDLSASPASGGAEAERLVDLRQRLDVSEAYDAVENISSTFGYYLDDYQWQRYVENYSVDGWRRKASGSIYIGRDSIFKGEALSYGPMPTTRDWIRLHTRLQPVIDIQPDARSAYIRTRMFLYFANTRSPGSWNSGMYPNDSAVLEDGIWKMKVGGWIDETYFNSRSYALGWARPDAPLDVPQQGRGTGGRQAGGPPADQLSYPPELPPEGLGARGYGVVRGYPGFASWPDIKPMWFHYLNPVTGRRPEFFCPDVTTCIGEVPEQPEAVSAP
ncbi:nuclear transport factor 2 family protein [Brevundimonas sp.]|uniref:nuclear transport factor 2 family protein n=1 Tax=Brevundimonas sp. TaxID=1871086 RepID=UPI00263629E6|nr:nuclear transport factor 2 family protein [Brevundimonas sp.]